MNAFLLGLRPIRLRDGCAAAPEESMEKDHG